MVPRIVLDPGHGAKSPHKKFYHESIGEWAYEGTLNRGIARHVERYLNILRAGDVLFTVDPDDPADPTLGDRVQTANLRGADIFVSIHCNASPSHNASGFEIFTSPGETGADSLATSISNALEDFLEIHNLQFRKDLSDRDPDKEVSFYVLRNTNMPAVLLECGFFDNLDDYLLLRDPLIQDAIGKYVASGIYNFLHL